MLEEQKVNDIVLVAMEESWDAIKTHKEVHRTAIELILRDGIESGEFEPVDPRDTSTTITRALAAYCHPILLAQGLQEGNDLEAEARSSHPLLAPRHRLTKVASHDPAVLRIIASKE